MNRAVRGLTSQMSRPMAPDPSRFWQDVVPSASSLLLALLTGILPLASGALAWDNGIRRGDRRLLATVAYGTPPVGALILVACGFAAPSIGIVCGGALIVAAGAISASRRA